MLLKKNREMKSLQTILFWLLPLAAVFADGEIGYREYPSSQPSSRGAILFVGGIGETQNTYRNIANQLTAEGYRVAVFIPQSEAENFVGPHDLLTEEFERSLQQMSEFAAPGSFQIWAHSMAFSVVENYLLRGESELTRRLDRVTYSNPMLSRGNFLVGAIDPELPAEGRLDLKFHLGQPDRTREVVISRSVGFGRSVEEGMARVQESKLEGRAPIPTQFLVTSTDPNVDHSLLPAYMERLQAAGQPVRREEFLLEGRDQHNPWRSLNQVLGRVRSLNRASFPLSLEPCAKIFLRTGRNAM